MSQSSARFPSRDDKYYWSANLDFFKDHLPLEKQTWNALAARGSFSDPAGQDPHSRARRTAPDAAPSPRGAGRRLVQRVAGATSQMAARPAPGQARPGGQSRLSPLTLQGESKAPQARPRGEGRRAHGLVTPEPVPQTRSRGGACLACRSPYLLPAPRRPALAGAGAAGWGRPEPGGAAGLAAVWSAWARHVASASPAPRGSPSFRDGHRRRDSRKEEKTPRIRPGSGFPSVTWEKHRKSLKNKT